MPKEFINEVDHVVDDAIEGLVKSNPDVCFHETCPRVILRANYKELAEKGAIALIAGGGSGHEPYAAGFVGEGLLTAAVCGNVFTSPPTSHVEAALNATKSEAGAILLVINYTGDRLNFGLAAERFKARGGKVRIVTVSDDVAIEEADNKVGRRGLAAAVLILKIAGAMSEKGFNMEQIVDYLNDVNENCGTLGVTLTPCSLPGKGRMFKTENDKMEIGSGIHGEPGKCCVNLENADSVVFTLMNHIIQSKKLETKTKKGSSIIVLLNNLGGVTQLEMGILKNAVIKWTEKACYFIDLLICGTVMTSLDCHGFSITILPVFKEQLQQYLELPVKCVSWPSHIIPPKYSKFSFLPTPQSKIEPMGTKLNARKLSEGVKLVRACIENVYSVLLEKQDELDALDGAAGDGDCGTTLAQAATIIHSKLPSLHLSHPLSLLRQLSEIFEHDVGGTTGAIYALLLNAGSSCFANSAASSNWLQALERGVEAVMKYGGAKPGDRTMIDTLHGVLRFFKSLEGKQSFDSATWKNAVEIAHEAAQSTYKMRAQAGRASYTSDHVQTQPDAGAMAAAFWIEALYKGVTDKS